MYPALAILQAMDRSQTDVLWVGGQGGMEEALVQRVNVPYTSIPAAGVHGVALRALPGNLLALGRGYFAARRIIRQYQPDVLLFTGGYLAAPVALAGRKLPSLLYVPDIEPGQALKFLGRFSTCIALTSADSQRYFSQKARFEVCGYPTRFGSRVPERAAAAAHFGLSADLPCVLVSGGSQGARSINRALLPVLPALLQKAQVIHLSGKLDWEEVKASTAQLPLELAGRYHPFAYLHEDMGLALAAADLVVSRAGASCLGEYPLFGVPAILVPYPYAWRYQRVNAEYLVSRGAADILEDASLADKLLTTMNALLDDKPRLANMRRAMFALAAPRAAQNLAARVGELAASHRTGEQR